MTAYVRGIQVGSREGSANLDVQTSYTAVYRVYTDDKNDGPAEVRQAFGIPNIGDPYTLGNDFDPHAVVTEKSARELESPTEWEVSVTYSSNADKPDNEQDQNPLNRQAEISYSTQARQKVIQGYYSNPQIPNSFQNLELGLTNTAGELFDPQPEIEVFDPVLTIEKNLSSVPDMSVGNTVNSATFYGAEPRTLRLMPPTCKRAYDASLGYYWVCTFQFVYRHETWDLQILSAGRYYINLAGDKKVPFTDSQGQPFIGLLTESGGPLNETASEVDWGRYVSGGDDPYFQRLRVFREIDFNSLGII